MHIYISEFVIPLCCRYQVVLSCTCKEYSKNMHDYFPVLQSNHLHQLWIAKEYIILDYITSRNDQERHTTFVVNSCQGKIVWVLFLQN